MLQHPASDDSGLLQVMAHGHALEAQGQLEQATQCYREWLLRHANAANAVSCWYEYGRLLFLQGTHDRAEHAFRSALEIQPHLLEATVALGKTMEAQGRLAEAIQTWEGALPRPATQIELLNNIARVSEGLHDPERTETALLDSLRLDNTQGPVITTLLQQRQKLCRWPVIDPALGVPVEVQQAHVGPLMSLALFDDPAANLQSVQRFLADKLYAAGDKPPLAQPGALYPNHARLRLGFLSADFKLHATSVFFLPLIEHLDRTRFEVVLLDITSGADPFPFARQQLLTLADTHLPLQELGDDDAARAIRAQEIDVLIDMAGLTSGARPGIVAQRPAPVQMSYIGFLGSSGIPNVDYILTTQDLFPDHHAESFTEKPLAIEGTYLSFVHDAPMDTGTRRADCGLDDDAFVFCALLNSYKITPEMFATWMDILRGVPGSLLWLVEENPTLRANLEQQARRHGIDPARLRFSPRVHPAEYRTRLALADLFLDSSPYGNGATTRDVLSANLPILTKPGNTMMSRLTAHMVSAIGLDELVVHDIDAYTAKAIDLGNRREELARLKARLIDNKSTSPLFDTRAFAQHFGEAVQRGAAQMQAVPAAPAQRQIEIHQIYYNEATRQKVMPGFIPLDNTRNERPDWFEFWVILNFLRTTPLREDTWYGFLSPRFHEKTGYDASQVLQSIRSAPQDTDVFLFSSVWDQACYFLNPWEQGEAWHPGLMQMSQQVLDRLGMTVQLSELVADSSCTVYSNYIVGNKRFWTAWQALAEQFFAFVEGEEGRHTPVAGDTAYGIAANRYPMKTFIQERFATLLLATEAYNVVYTDDSQTGSVFRRLFDDNAETRRALQTCDLMKRKFRQTGDARYLAMYRTLRADIAYHPPELNDAACFDPNAAA